MHALVLLCIALGAAACASPIVDPETGIDTGPDVVAAGDTVVAVDNFVPPSDAVGDAVVDTGIDVIHVADANACTAGTTLCSGLCVATAFDPNHCGSCTNACAAGTVCMSGTCQLICLGGSLLCNGSCINPMNDPAFCGASGDCAGSHAGTVCDPGRDCIAGTCRGTCPAGQINCGGTCIDPSTNRMFCGASGSCMAPMAGTVCTTGQICMGGTCQFSCPAGEVFCQSRCVDPATDRANCGATGDCMAARAGTACMSGQVCTGGRCVASCPSNLTMCPSGTSTACLDTMNDPNACGSCSNRCPSGQVCAAGMCQPLCLNGTTACGTGATAFCTNLAADPMNCGACGVACGPGQGCSAQLGCQVTCSNSIDGDLIVTQDRTLTSGTYNYRAFRIAPGVRLRVTGNVPLVIKAASDVHIDGILDASAVHAAPGPAGGVGSTSTGGTAPSATGTPATAGSSGLQGAGGGGGGNLNAGGTGGAVFGSTAGQGGSAYSDPQMTVFTGGGGGGGGGAGGAGQSPSSGGGGGGAVRISAPVISIGVSGQVLANGGDGAIGSFMGMNGGGGGGAGGMIWLDASGQLTNAGQISATSGPGGSASAGGGAGGNGSIGRVQFTSPRITNTGTAAPGAFMRAAAPCP